MHANFYIFDNNDILVNVQRSEVKIDGAFQGGSVKILLRPCRQACTDTPGGIEAPSNQKAYG